jgi:hypothetical protein
VRSALLFASPPLALSQEGRITRWLHAARALRATDAEADSADEAEEGGGAGRGGGDDDDDEGGGVKGWRGGTLPPCPSCGRTYPHEHVRALRAGGADESDSD